MKTILFHTHFSDFAAERLASASRLAHQNGAKIIVLAHIEVPDPYVHPTASLLNFALEEAQEKREKDFLALKRSLPQDLMGKVDLQMELIIGNQLESILLAAKKYQPSVILLGDEGANKRTFVIEKLIKSAPCPVLALSPNMDILASPNLVYATNFRKEDQRIIDKLLAFAEDFSGKLHCIHIKKDKGEIDLSKVIPWQQHYRKEIEKGLISFEVLYQQEVYQNLDAAWKKYQPGFWVMPLKRSNWWRGWLSPSSSVLDVLPSSAPIFALNYN